ncbi:MAG: phosphonate ABC transporter substrate-binding protein [Alphaproteobacteria bacterium]|nr:MAG: phosphonate ABC transporter substrate-binding protein [Alphaproteobacteria bacterium]
MRRPTEARLTRRRAVAGVLAAGGAVLAAPAVRAAAAPFRLGLTPVFLDSDAVVVDALEAALADLLGRRVVPEQRRTYAEVTQMLLDDAIDGAWLCGYPYLQHRDALDVAAVPVWRGRPLYQSYLIVHRDDPARSLADLEGSFHAFSDPDSNSGYLVTASDLARMGRRPEEFFSRVIFTYGHRNVVRAVASGLVRSGSVDGYVWEVLNDREPAITARTRVIARSEWLGFPPFCVHRSRVGEPAIEAFRKALLALHRTGPGRRALALLELDRMTPATPGLFAGIAARMRLIRRA